MELVSVEDVALSHGTARMLTLAASRRPQSARPRDDHSPPFARRGTPTPTLSVAVLVITGAGPAFSAGGDLRAYARPLPRARTTSARSSTSSACVNARMEHGRFVSIAMVNGACVAGGLEFALGARPDHRGRRGAHRRRSSRHRSDRRRGREPAAGARPRGAARKQLLLTGRLWTGAEAAAAGLAVFSAPAAELRDRTLKLATELAVHSPLAVKHMKTLVGYSEHLAFEDALSAEQELVMEYATQSHDATEGLEAFLARRAPNYTGQ